MVSSLRVHMYIYYAQLVNLGKRVDGLNARIALV